MRSRWQDARAEWLTWEQVARFFQSDEKIGLRADQIWLYSTLHAKREILRHVADRNGVEAKFMVRTDIDVGAPSLGLKQEGALLGAGYRRDHDERFQRFQKIF